CAAVIVAQAFGIDTATLVDVLNASTGRNNTTEVKMKPQILSGAFSSGFAMALMAKDVATAADLAQALGCGTSGTASQARLWAEALAMLGHHADHTEMYRFLQATGEQAERLGAAGSKSGGEHGKIGEDRSGADGADRPR
nr:NAD-binding protein [Rhizobiaceae bacterium]